MMNNDLSGVIKKNQKSLPRKLSGVFGVRYSKLFILKESIYQRNKFISYYWF